MAGLNGHEAQDEKTEEARAGNVPARVVLVAASRLVREGLRSLLKNDEFAVAGEARDLEEVVSIIDAATDVVLIDLPLDADAGHYLAQVRDLARRFPKARIVLFGDSKSDDWLRRCLDAGIAGYLSKDVSASALHGFLRLILAGERVFSSELVKAVLNRSAAALERSGGTPGEISEQEQQVLTCLVRGFSNRTIARQLRVSEATIKVRMKGLLRKINATNRTQAAIWAVDHGFASSRDETN